MERHPSGMFGLISGACLGDTFVREAISSAIVQAARAGRKGSGKKFINGGSKDDGGDNIEGVDRFTTWSMGLQ